MSKTIVTRIKNKVDSLSVWQNSVVNKVDSSTRLLNGEIALVRVPTGESYTNPVTGKTEPVIELLMKVGDGTSTFDQLPWLSAKAADVYDWAKASTVVVDEAGSNLVFKNAGGTAVYSVSLDKFALASNLNSLDARVADIEAALGVDSGEENSVSSRLEAVEGAITVINGEASVVGSIKKAEADAKAYTDEREVEIKKYADTAESDAVATAKSYTDTEVKKASDAASGVAADLTAHTSAANPHGITAETVGLGNVENKSTTTIKSEFTGSVATGNDGFVTGGSVYAAIEGAKAAAASDAAAKVKALEDGKVATNASEIARVEGLVTAEKNRAEGIESGLRTDVDKIKTFFAVAEGETLDTALDTLVEIQDYLNGDGSATGGMIDRLAQAETDIDNLEKEFNTDTGRVKVAEGKIAALEAKDAELEEAIGTKLATETFNGHVNGDHAKTATEITTEINTAVNGEKSAREAAIKGINDKIGTVAEGKTVVGMIGEAQNAGTNAASEAARAHSRLDIVEPKVNTLNDIVDGYTTKGSIKSAIDGVDAKFADYAKSSDVYTKTAADGKFALSSTVSTNTTNISNNSAAIEDIEGRVDTIEGSYAKCVGDKLYIGEEEIIFDCGGAPQA